jgi:hypothetical protein
MRNGKKSWKNRFLKVHCDHNGNKSVFTMKKVVTINIFAAFLPSEFFETKVKQMKQK